MPMISYKQKNQEKAHPLLASEKPKRAGSGFGSVILQYGITDSDPYQNVTDPKHW
jgi:hypothetical protein